MTSKYKRILLKLSGQIIAGKNDFGFSKTSLSHLKNEIKQVHNLGVQIGIVIGGGNIFRGKRAVKDFDVERVSADFMGMLATLINALLLQNILEAENLPTRVMSAINVAQLAEPFIRRRAITHLENKVIVIFACGTGNPFFTTDTAAVLKAIETESQVIIKGTKVRGIYDKDPEKYTDAKFYPELKYRYVIEKNLQVMDTTAFTLAMENNLPILVFNILKKGLLLNFLSGKHIGTMVTKY